MIDVPDSSTPPTIGQYLVSRLVAAGTRHVFGVPGDYTMRLLDEIVDDPDLTWVGTATELGAAYAADGYARLRGLGVVCTTYGVGELSALSGLAGSAAESVPVLHIVGSPTTAAQRAGSPVHHSLLDGDLHHFVRALDEVVCASAVLTADDAADEIDRVLATVLECKRPGSISVPSDLVDVPITVRHRPAPQPVPPATPGAAAEFDARAGELLATADSVVVLVDHLAARYDTHAQLDALVRGEHVRSAVTIPGKGLLDETLPGFLGLYIGAHSEEAVRTAVEGADVVIGVGLRWADLSSGGFTTQLDATRLIDVQPTYASVDGTTAQLAMTDTLGALRRIMGTRAVPEARMEWPVPDGVPLASGPLTQARFWERFGQFLRPGDIVAADQGTAFYGLAALDLPPEVDVIAQPLWAAIGYALPAAMGAHLAADERRRTILVTGDGAAQMTVQEIGTMLRYGLDPIVVILNNDGYTVERAIHGPTAPYNDIARWNWGAVPAALGATAGTLVHRVVTASELDAALSACETRPGELALIEVVLDPFDVPELMTRTVVAYARRKQ